MKRLLLLLALGLLSSAVGAGPKPKEGLGLGFSGDWSVGFHKDEGATSITEFVPHDEKVESWTRLVTVQEFRPDASSLGSDPREFYERLQRQREEICPGMTKWNLLAQDEHRVVYEWTTTGECGSSPPNHELAAFLVGRSLRYRVAYTSKKVPMEDATRDAWVRVLECLQITDKSNGQPVWGRPQAPPWVQQVMETKRWTVAGYSLSELPVAAGAVMKSCNASVNEDRAAFVAGGEGDAWVLMQVLGRRDRQGIKSLADEHDHKLERNKKDCGTAWTTRVLAEGTDRLVWEDVFHGCKRWADRTDVNAVFMTDDQYFWWASVRMGLLGEDERSALIAGVLAVHLERAPDAR